MTTDSRAFGMKVPCVSSVAAPISVSAGSRSEFRSSRIFASLRCIPMIGNVALLGRPQQEVALRQARRRPDVNEDVLIVSFAVFTHVCLRFAVPRSLTAKRIMRVQGGIG